VHRGPVATAALPAARRRERVGTVGGKDR
jgi:hypothetical protein